MATPYCHFLDIRVIVVGTGRFDCFFTGGREVKIKNNSHRFLRVYAEMNVATINILVIDPKLIERMETFGRCIPPVAHLFALSSSTSNVYDIVPLRGVASTT